MNLSKLKTSIFRLSKRYNSFTSRSFYKKSQFLAWNINKSWYLISLKYIKLFYFKTIDALINNENNITIFINIKKTLL